MEHRRGGGGGANGFFSLRTISGYLKSGASAVSSTVRSAGASVASSVADRTGESGRDQVHWAGFDKLECEGGILREVLLLAYRSGFQVWDVEEGDNVHQLVARYDGSVTFLQVQKNPLASKSCQDKFADVRPLLVAALDQSASGKNTVGVASPYSGTNGNSQELGNENLLPIAVRFYSLRTHEYVHILKFRSPVYSIRCSPRVIAVSQASQIHCFDAATLEKEYTIVTFPMVPVSLGSGGTGCGPLALGSRWLAYSGAPIEVACTVRVSPQHLAPSTGFLPHPPNGSLVAHYAKESTKQFAAGIVTLGDVGYKTLTKYCSELIPDNNSSMKHSNPSLKTSGTINQDLPDLENIGTVIVRDIVSKSVVVQFRAHKSPICALSFDPSGILLVTASVHGHNINVFQIVPSFFGKSSSDLTGTCIHLYRLQRGITNAVIQDISFSVDSKWIMISSSRGTSHLFSISPYGGKGGQQFSDAHFNNNNKSDLTASSAAQWLHPSATSKISDQSLSPSGTPVTLSVVGRIKNGSNGWKGAVSGAAAAATGRVSPLPGAVASVFHNCRDSGVYQVMNPLSTRYYLLVFSPSGCVVQYVLRHSTGDDPGIDMSGLSVISHGSLHETESRLVVEALEKWDVCHKRSRRDRGDNIDVYGHGNAGNTKVVKKGTKRLTGIYPEDTASDLKVKATIEEKNHVYISEAELQMHTAQIPMWAKSKIHFQVMVGDNTSQDTKSALGGEVEIERVPVHTIEARTKDLIPVFDYLPTFRFGQPRAHSFGSSRSEPQMCQKSDMSDDGRNSCRSSCTSLECGLEIAAAAALPSVLKGNCYGGFRSSLEVHPGFVNNSMDSTNMKVPLEFVNTSEGFQMENQLEHENNNDSPQMENHFVGYDNNLDNIDED